MLREFDARILDFHERFAHAWQRFAGHDCFDLANFLVCVRIVVLMAFIVLLLWREYLLIPGFIDLSFALLIAASIYRSGKRMRNFLINTANPLKLFFSFRLPLVLLVTFFSSRDISVLSSFYSQIELSSIALYSLSQWCYVSAVYFISCDPLPPGTSKVKQWLKAGVQFLRETLTPAPQPKPVPVPSR